MNAKKVFCFIMAGILALSSCACQKAPSEKTVSSKSSGTTNYTSSATASGTGDIGEAVRVKNEEQFFSTDDSVEFAFNIDKTVPVCAMPVVRVSPDFLSEEDAKRVANVLFGEVDYYESEPVFSPQYSKDEIQERIRRWSPFTNAQAVQELYGQPMDHVVGIVQSFIEEYTLQFEQAPDESPHKPCAWKFRKTSEYRYSDEQIREEQIDTSADNDEITASLRVNNIEYQFNAATRNKKDYKLNYISAYPYTGISPNGIDSLIVSSQLCRTEKPTDEEMSYAFSLADAWLEDMELGEWSIDQCSVKTTYYGDVPEYVICISAVPVLHGTNAIRYPQLDNLKSKDVYASNYYYTDAYFEFSANGDLMLFRMYSPIEIKEVVNENVEMLSMDELLSKAKDYLKLSDLYAYGIGSETENLEDKIGCKIEIPDFDMGLTRIKVQDSDDYYYVPSIVLKGNIEYFDKEGMDILFTADNVTLLVLNAIDGSIIPFANK